MLALTLGPYPRHLGQRLLLAGVVLAPVLLLRRWPLPVLAATTAANALLIHGRRRLPFGIMLGVASYFAAARLPRRVSIRAAVISAAALGGALIYAALTVQQRRRRRRGRGKLPAADGGLVHRRQRRGPPPLPGRPGRSGPQRASRRSRTRPPASPRGTCPHRPRDARRRGPHPRGDHRPGRRRPAPHGPATGGSQHALESIETIGRTAQEELRVVLGLLRDQENRTAVLAPAPRLVDVKDLVETVRASGTPVDLHMSGIDRPLSPALELTVYRVVQEALTNVVKHAPHAHATVDLAVCDHEIRLAVTDDGAPAGRHDARAASRPRHRRNARARSPPSAASSPPSPWPARGFRVTRPGPDRGRRVTTTVLVVDDQALLRTAFSSLIAAEDDLEVAGQAADGRQAVELAHRLAPDVVVMDVRMPVMDGIEATRHITADQSRPPASSSSPPSTWTSTSSRRCAPARAASRSRAARWRSC